MGSNPYRSPTDGGVSEPTPEPSNALATWAIWLSVIFGISPVSADTLSVAFHAGEPLYYIAIYLLFLAVMIAPLAMLFSRGGTRAFVKTPIRITMSCLIIALYVVAYGSLIVSRF